MLLSKLLQLKNLLLILSLMVGAVCPAKSEIGIVITSPMEVTPGTQAAQLKNVKPTQLPRLTPGQYKKLTGKNLSIKEIIRLKKLQAKMKKKFEPAGEPTVPKVAYVLLAIFSLAWIVMGISDKWSGENWWLNLLLALLCWIPGFIHSMIKMKDYYPEKLEET